MLIKDFLKNEYLINRQNVEKFNLREKLEKSVHINNKTKHSITGFCPNFVFNSNNSELFIKIQ